MKNSKKLFFGYRLTTDTDEYIQRVRQGVKTAMETQPYVHVLLAFVKGIDRAVAENVLHAVDNALDEMDKTCGINGEKCYIRVSPFLEISLQTIRRCEGKSNAVTMFLNGKGGQS